MRCTFLLFPAFLGSLACAQTVTSVQDGDWNDPSTWDCNCVPGIEEVEILHTVQLTTNMKMTMQYLHVADGAALTMDAPHLLIMLEEIVNDGLMLLAGYVDVDGELFNNRTIHVDGQFFSHGLLMMGGWGSILTAVDMEMGGMINGQGRICISGASYNYGVIQGEVDICDLTPTTSTPPFLDTNTGTVAPTVTFCAVGTCTVGLPEVNGLDNLSVWPVPANEQINLDGLPSSLACTLELRDAMGRTVPVRSERIGDRMIVDIDALPVGLYLLTLSTPNDTRSVKVVVE